MGAARPNTGRTAILPLYAKFRIERDIEPARTEYFSALRPLPGNHPPQAVHQSLLHKHDLLP